MAIKVIAQRREVKLGKNPGKKFVMRPDLYIPIKDRDAPRPLHPHQGEEGIPGGSYPQRNLRRCDQGGLGCSR